MTASSSDASANLDLAYQSEVLQGVARTFALTIAQLPGPLRDIVGNVYLVCRIADTIEDEPVLTAGEKEVFSERLVEIVAGGGDAVLFAGELGALLSSSTTEHERDLVANTARVVRVTMGFTDVQRRAVERCVRIMSRGMVEFQRDASVNGLQDVARMDRYCYHVAGIVGETLTTLFCNYSEQIDRRRDELFGLAVSFGQGLQMINILKDVWEDQRRGVCWLPRDVFEAAGFNLRDLAPGRADVGFVKGLSELVGIARGHLENALRYILLIPARETGIRRSCVWPLALAVLTLRRIHGTPAYGSGQQVKISRRRVWATVAVTGAVVRSNLALKLLFRWACRGLPAGSGPT